MTCHLFNNKNKENKEKLVRKQQLFFRAHSPILPHAVAKMKDKVFFFFTFSLFGVRRRQTFFLAHKTLQQSDFFLLSIAKIRLKKRSKRQLFRAKMKPVALKRKACSMKRWWKKGTSLLLF